MALYQRIPAAQIEAVQFNERLAAALRAHVNDGAPRPGDAPAALTYEEHAGYKLGVDRVAFGDYIVGGSSVVSREAFEEQYELARVQAEPEPIALTPKDESAARVLDAVKSKPAAKAETKSAKD